MSESRAAGWPSNAPTATQMKEFFSQIASGRITEERLRSFLGTEPPVASEHVEPEADLKSAVVKLFELCELLDQRIYLTGRRTERLLEVSMADSGERRNRAVSEVLRIDDPISDVAGQIVEMKYKLKTDLGI